MDEYGDRINYARHFKIGDRNIYENSLPFVIAEIGHNHGGSVEKCKTLMYLARECGCDAVKLQKRDNKKLYTKTLYNQPYENRNSFGRTYGEHREALEFNMSQYAELKQYADRLGLIFFATAFDQRSADLLERLPVDVFKIASGDLTNTPLIKYIAAKGLPVIISTGGGSWGDIARAAYIMDSAGTPFALLHCVASYPNRPEELNLSFIAKLRKVYAKTIIGFSSHYDGILAAVSAYHYGARIIEQHFTDSHVAKGSDHALSLQPQGMAELVKYLGEAYRMRGDGVRVRLDREACALKKMEKSIYPARSIGQGEKITAEDITIRSPGGGLPPYSLNRVIDKIVISPMSTGVPIDLAQLETQTENSNQGE